MLGRKFVAGIAIGPYISMGKRRALVQAVENHEANIWDLMESNNLTSVAPLPVARQEYIHVEVTTIPGCPCAPSAPFSIVSYRAVQANIQHKDNFLPKAILEPELLKGASPSKACGMWGLSMYENPASLKAMILRVEKTVKNFRKKIGDHYAEMELTPTHGTRTPANKSDHFDFYGYKNCDYISNVKVVKPLF